MQFYENFDFGEKIDFDRLDEFSRESDVLQSSSA
jgi:hypothetical protein